MGVCVCVCVCVYFEELQGTDKFTDFVTIDSLRFSLGGVYHLSGNSRCASAYLLFSLTFFSFLCFFFLNLSAHLFVCFLVTCKKVTCPDAPQLCEGVPLFSPSPPWAPSRTIHGSWTLGNHSHVFINHRFTQHVADFGRQFYPQYSKNFVHQFLRMRLTAAPPHCEKKKKTFKIVKVVLVGILKVRPAPANSPAVRQS